MLIRWTAKDKAETLMEMANIINPVPGKGYRFYGELYSDKCLEEDDAGFRDRLISLKGNQASTKVAREMGINPYKYIRYEQGVEFPSTKAIRKIADYFDVGVDWLAYGDELAKDYPVNEGMIEFLKKSPEVRKEIWEKYYKG